MEKRGDMMLPQRLRVDEAHVQRTEIRERCKRLRNAGGKLIGAQST